MARTAVLPEVDRTALFDLLALLFTYPDDELFDAGPELMAAAAALPEPQDRETLGEFLTWFTGTPRDEVQEHFVATFDLRRKSGLYLTYYLHGDTRKRGVALLTLKQRYRAHGLVLRAGELPDLLPVVLEFAALVGAGDGEAPLRQHRRGLELLRAALAQVSSPYELLVDAICRCLPELTQSDREAIAALAVDGPPVETVGMESLLGPGAEDLPGQALAPYASCSQSEVSR